MRAVDNLCDETSYLFAVRWCTSEPNQCDASQACTRSTIWIQSIVRQCVSATFQLVATTITPVLTGISRTPTHKAARTGRHPSEDAIVKEPSLRTAQVRAEETNEWTRLKRHASAAAAKNWRWYRETGARILPEALAALKVADY